MTRQLAAAVMLRRMTGRELATEKVWLRKTFGMIDSADGQLHRPARSFCKAKVEDVGLPLGALNAAALDGNEPARQAALQMAEGYLRRLREGDLKDAALHCFSGFSIKSLMVTARLLGSEAAFEAARILAKPYAVAGETLTPDNRFGPRTHTHGMLKTLVGLADYALTAGEPVLFSRVDALYRHMKTLGTRFGFLPEVINWRTSDMERLARNHLAESQIRDASFLVSDNTRADTHQFSWREIGERIAGAWAGWTSPNHVLAYRETLNAHWGGPELRDKIRFLQNCCGGSGVNALFIRCGQPYCGITTIDLARDCAVKVRIPEPVAPDAVRVTVNGQLRPIADSRRSGMSLLGEALPKDGLAGVCRVVGNYLALGECRAGDRIEMTYPLPVVTEEVAVGNPGYRQWRYRVTLKGDTVVRLEPVGNDVAKVYSDFDKMEREVFYGEAGPGPLYRREHFLRNDSPAPAPLVTDAGGLDYWRVNR
jgi:hypothetical protein